MLVEPLLVLSLVFALPMASWLEHRRASSSDIGSTVVIAAGLALFLGVARPASAIRRRPARPGSS